MSKIGKVINFCHLLYSEAFQAMEHFVLSYPDTKFGYYMRSKLYRKKRIKIGINAVFSQHSKMYANAPVVIGDNFSFGRNSILDPNDSFGVIIGNNVGIGPMVFLRAANHDYTDPEKPFKDQGHIAKKITSPSGEITSIFIDDDVWIGANSVLLTGTKIGKGCVVCAGSILGGKYPDHSIIAGNPGRVVASRKITSFVKKYHKFP